MRPTRSRRTQKRGFFKTLLLLATIILLLAIIAGNLGRYHWILELFSHFMVQYAIASAVITVLLLLARVKGLVVLMLAVTLFQFYDIRTIWLKDRMMINGEYEDITLMQYNVNKDKTEIEPMAEWIYTQVPNVDVIVLLETTERWKDVLTRLEKDYPHHQSIDMRGGRTAVILSKLPTESITIENIGEFKKPILVMKARTDKFRLPLSLTVMHPPPPVTEKKAVYRDEQLSAVAKIVSEDPTLYKVLAGDFNVSPWSYYFDQLIHFSGLKNGHQGMGLHTTWPSWRNKLGITIDHTLVSPTIKVLSRETGPNLGSDHLPVITKLRIPYVDTGCNTIRTTRRAERVSQDRPWLAAPAQQPAVEPEVVPARVTNEVAPAPENQGGVGAPVGN